MQLTKKNSDMLDYLRDALWWRWKDDNASIDRKVAAADYRLSENLCRRYWK